MTDVHTLDAPVLDDLLGKLTLEQKVLLPPMPRCDVGRTCFSGRASRNGDDGAGGWVVRQIRQTGRLGDHRNDRRRLRHRERWQAT